MTYTSQTTFDTSIGTLKILDNTNGTTVQDMRAALDSGEPVVIDDAPMFIRAVEFNEDRPDTVGVRVEQVVP